MSILRRNKIFASFESDAADINENPVTNESMHDLEVEKEVAEATAANLEFSAEEEQINDGIDEALDDVEHIGEIQTQVEEVGEQGLSAESYMFVQSSLNRIYAKYGVKATLPSNESFSGYSMDRRLATKDLIASMESEQESLLKRILNTIVAWVRKGWEQLKSFVDTLARNTSRSSKAILTRLKNIGNFTKSKVKLEHSFAFKVLLNVEGKLIEKEQEFHDQFIESLVLLKDLEKVNIDSYIAGLDKLSKEKITDGDTLLNELQQSEFLFSESGPAKKAKSLVAKRLGVSEDELKVTSPLLGGKVLYKVNKPGGETGVYTPDVDFSGDVVEAIVVNKEDLENLVKTAEEYSDKFLKVQQSLESPIKKLTSKLEEFGKTLKDEKDKDFVTVSKQLVSEIKNNVNLINKSITLMMKDFDYINKYASKVISNETKSDAEAAKA